MKIAKVSAVGLLLLVVGIVGSQSAKDSVGGSSSGEEEMGEDLRFSIEMNRQLSGRAEWNEELVRKFLDERKEVMDLLLKVCELSTKEATFRYSIFGASAYSGESLRVPW